MNHEEVGRAREKFPTGPTMPSASPYKNTVMLLPTGSFGRELLDSERRWLVAQCTAESALGHVLHMCARVEDPALGACVRWLAMSADQRDACRAIDNCLRSGMRVVVLAMDGTDETVRVFAAIRGVEVRRCIPA